MTKSEITSLIETHKIFLMRFSMERSNRHKEDAEELYQDTVLKLLINNEKFDPGQGKFTTYAARVMRNIAIDKYRCNKNKAHNSYNTIDISEFYLDDENSVDLDYLIGNSINEGLYKVDQEFIMDLINNLPKRCKEALVWRMQGYDYDTIAKTLNVNINTLKPNIHRARKIIREKLNQENNTENYKLVA